MDLFCDLRGKQILHKLTVGTIVEYWLFPDVYSIHTLKENIASKNFCIVPIVLQESYNVPKLIVKRNQLILQYHAIIKTLFQKQW